MKEKTKKEKKKEEKKKDKERMEFLELQGDLILLIDGYRNYRLKNYETFKFRIRNQDAGKRLRIDLKKTFKTLERICQIQIPGVPKLKKIQIMASIFGVVQFAITFVGFVLSRWGYIPEALGPLLFVSFIIASFVPLIGVYANNKIAHKVQDYYINHPKKFGMQRDQMKKDVQTLLDLLKDELRNEDEKIKDKYGILKSVNADYKGIKILKSPGRLRSSYWIKLVEN